MFRLPETTTNSQIAAAAVTIGIAVTTHRKIHEGLGEEQKTYTLTDKGLIPGLNIDTSQLLRLHNTGELERTDPTHPFLDALRGVINRGFLVKWIHERKTCALTQHPDPRCPRTLYQFAAPAAPSVVGVPEMVQTPHLAVAAALSTLGVPVIKIEGETGPKIFTLPRYGYSLHGLPQLDAKALIEDFKSGKLAIDNPLHPFLWAHSAVRNYKALMDHMAREMPLVFFEDAKGSGRAALIRLDAKSEAFDSSQKFFNRRILSR